MNTNNDLNILLETKDIELEFLNRALTSSNHSSLDAYIAEGQRLCDMYSKSRIMRLVHLIRRVRYGMFSKNKEQRKSFWNWILRRPSESYDGTFNMMYQLMEVLKSCERIVNNLPPEKTDVIETMKDCLDKPYSKFDVLVFSIISYDYRHQRPQHVADYYAAAGHRVFYINVDFNRDGSFSVTQKNENLYVVTLPNRQYSSVYQTIFDEYNSEAVNALEGLIREYCIKDAVMISGYPNWVLPLLRFKNKYGFPLVTDYMDDFAGFKDPEHETIGKACKLLLSKSDLVVASSQYLVDQAKKYASNVVAIRNGTEFEHFHTARGSSGSSARKNIGYYGAINHWFDFEKIYYLSARFPEHDITLIGNVDINKEKLEKLPNVKLLGEKNYSDLPDYLKTFDVCLIPFDASLSLIQATNPVKFYEYLSAGKKVVATEIPELEPFRDRYVYLANDNQTFGDYVELCLNGKDTLASPEECYAFAKENDWASRIQQFYNAITTVFPKISIIVLCYNQLDYTKVCVESILKNTAYPNYELILVDNNSQDDTAQWLQEMDAKHDCIKILLNKTNRGFAGGNNDGLQIATGDYLLLLNNDTLVTRGWLTSMLAKFSNPSVGMVGPVTNSIGNESRINVDYENTDDMPLFAHNYTTKNAGMIYPNDPSYLAMFCVMFSRDIFNRIGLLDENYGRGMFEDDDYSAAIHNLDLRTVIAEDAFVHHFGSVSFKKLEDAEYRALVERNKAYFEQKWGHEWIPPRYRPDLKL